jgi:hypothetical protein
LGNKLACNRIEAFELLLTNPLSISVKHSDKQLVLNIPAPETFLFHKGITFVMRSNEVKRDKDLFYVYFILKFCPDRKELLKSLNHFEKHELMETFRQNINDYLSDISKPGYLMLRPFVKRWEEERNINNEIKSIFDTLFQVIG